MSSRSAFSILNFPPGFTSAPSQPPEEATTAKEIQVDPFLSKKMKGESSTLIFFFIKTLMKRYTQIAVASFGKTTCSSSPVGFTRITPAVLRWIKQTIGYGFKGRFIADP